MGLVSAAAHSYGNAKGLLRTEPYANFQKQRAFIDRLLHDLGELQSRGVQDPVFVNRKLPPYVLGWVGSFRNQSTLFGAMGIHGTFGPPFPRIFYVITDQGAVLQVGH